MALMELNLSPQRSHLRTFGLACCILAGILAAAWWKTAPPLALVLLGVAVLAGVASLLAPGLLRWPFIVATLIAWPVGFVVSWILLAAIFYGLFTPIGLVRRLFGDSLDRRLDPSAASYWRERPPPRSARRYFRQH